MPLADGLEAVSPKATAASERAKKQWGAYAVSPLISLLYDLKHIQEEIIASLEHLGADLTSLPHPFREMLSNKSHSQSMPLHVDTQPTTPLEAYAALLHARRSTSHHERSAMVESLLAMVACPVDVDASHQLKYRRIAAALVASGLFGDGRPCITVNDDLAATQLDWATKRSKHEPVVDVAPHGAASGGEDWKCVGEMDERNDFGGFLRSLEQYENDIASKEKDLARVLSGVCETGLSRRHRAKKRPRVGHLDNGVGSSSATMEENCEQLVRMCDALAAVQRHTQEKVNALRESLDTLSAETAVVSKQTGLFWRSAQHLECEYHAFKDVRRRMKKVRKTLAPLLKESLPPKEVPP